MDGNKDGAPADQDGNGADGSKKEQARFSFITTPEVLNDLKELRWKLRKESVADVINTALKEFIERNRD